MLIRHKIIIWFIGLSGLLLCLFSIYIYVASDNSRKQLFQERLKNKAFATKEIYELHDKVAERIITTIPEQSEYIFDEHNKLVFAINDLSDFNFNINFFKTVELKSKMYFRYIAKNRLYDKDGYAFTFDYEKKKRTLVITAYNKTGLEQLASLATILIVGNLFFLVLIGFSAYILSNNALSPINNLVKQAESVQGHDLKFRLQYANPNNEIGIVATAFNKILERMQGLVESQKSFVSYASHELRTPLAAIAGILETSLTYDRDIESTEKSLKAAQKEIYKATGLVNGLLQLAKMESIDEVLEKQRVNIVEVLLDSISIFKSKQPSQDFLFVIVDKELSEDYIELEGNAYLLRTAVINLIDNASKYSNLSKIEIKLSIDVSDKIKIQIIDKGIGILSDDVKFVRNPFFRGTNTFGVEGFGLGLALTQRIIALHHGELLLLKNEFEGVTAEIVLSFIK